MDYEERAAIALANIEKIFNDVIDVIAPMKTGHIRLSDSLRAQCLDEIKEAMIDHGNDMANAAHQDMISGPQ